MFYYDTGRWVWVIKFSSLLLGVWKVIYYKVVFSFVVRIGVADSSVSTTSSHVRSVWDCSTHQYARRSLESVQTGFLKCDSSKSAVLTSLTFCSLLFLTAASAKSNPEIPLPETTSLEQL